MELDGSFVRIAALQPPPDAKSTMTPSTARASSSSSIATNPDAAGGGARPSSSSSSSSRNSSCSSSSDGEPSAKKPRPVGIRGGTRSSTVSNPPVVVPSSYTENAFSSSIGVLTASTGGGSDGVVAGIITSAGLSPSSTRLGRVIKKPARLEEQPSCRQSLSGRSGRADAPARLKARDEATRSAATPTAAATCAAAAATPTAAAATAKVGDEASETAAKLVEENRDVGAGAERCVARLGTAVVPGAGTGRLLWSSGGSDEAHVAAGKVGTTRSSTRGVKRDIGTADLTPSIDSNSNSISSRSGGGGVVGSRGPTGGAGSSVGSVVRTALPAARRTAGVALASGDTEEGSGNGEVGMGAGAGGGKEAGAGRAVTPEVPPVRPVGGLGEHPDDTIKEYKRAYDDVR